MERMSPESSNRYEAALTMVHYMASIKLSVKQNQLRKKRKKTMKNIKIKKFLIINDNNVDEINDWIAKNDIDVIDIKMQAITPGGSWNCRIPVLVMYRDSSEAPGSTVQ